MIKLVLFDIDGTLVHTGGAGMRAFSRTFATEFNLPHGAETMRFAGRTDTSLVREFFLKHHITPTREHYWRFFESYVFWLDHFLHELDGGSCLGVPAFLAQLKKLSPAPPLGLLTGNIRLGAEIKLRHYNLWEEFCLGAFGDDHEERNELARIALERARVLLGKELRGEEILVVGDTPLDIACARAIEARVLAVATGAYTVAELEEHQPDWAVENLEVAFELIWRPGKGVVRGRKKL